MILRLFAVILSVIFISSCGVKEQAAPNVTPAPTAVQAAQTAEPIVTPAPKANDIAKATAKPKAVPTAAAEKKMQTVTVSVMDGDGKVMLADTEIEYKSALSAFDALKTACEGKLEIKSSGFGAFVYVQGIGKLFEFDKGAMSGWLYLVNGAKADKSAGAFKLNSGDKVVWKYTLDGQR